jgi:hypothetical protein
MEEALAVVRQNARVALRHLVAQGALSDDQAQVEPEYYTISTVLFYTTLYYTRYTILYTEL